MIITIVLAVLCLILVIMLRHERQQSTKKTNFLLDAISAGDYSFKFLEKQRIGDSILRLGGSSSREIGMNAALNRITRIMQDAYSNLILACSASYSACCSAAISSSVFIGV